MCVWYVRCGVCVCVCGTVYVRCGVCVSVWGGDEGMMCV